MQLVTIDLSFTHQAVSGAWKASGIGREEYLEELLSYTQSKAVHVLLD